MPARTAETAADGRNGTREGSTTSSGAQTAHNGHVIWTEADVADFLRLRQSTVAAMARRGDLPSIRLGRHRRYLQTDIVRYVAALRRQSA
jgi:excisionase family DNA binding protein